MAGSYGGKIAPARAFGHEPCGIADDMPLSRYYNILARRKR
jgi:hypothetical protein